MRKEDNRINHNHRSTWINIGYFVRRCIGLSLWRELELGMGFGVGLTLGLVKATAKRCYSTEWNKVTGMTTGPDQTTPLDIAQKIWHTLESPFFLEC